MDLFPLRFMLEMKLGRCELAFKNVLSMTNKDDNLRRRHHLEGLLSDAWQAYCSFVRALCIRSCTGCTTAGGVVHVPSITPPHWKRASYIAHRAHRGAAIQPALLNDVMRREPTWGDADKIVTILTALQPGNVATLKSHLAGGLSGPKHCQTVRNACAHRNHQTKAEVEHLAASYIASSIKYPTDAMLWREPTTKVYAYLSWLDDMKTIAEGAVG